MRSRAQFTMRVLRNTDILCLAALAARIWDVHPLTSRYDLLALILLVPFNAALLQYAGLYESHRVEGIRELVRNLLSAQVATLSACALLLPFGLYRHRSELLAYFALGFAAIFFQRIILYSTLRLLRSRGFDLRRTCVIGSREDVAEMDRKFGRTPSWGLKIFYWGQPLDGDSHNFYAFPSGAFLRSSLKDLLHNEAVDEVLIFSRPAGIDAYRSLLALCKDYGVTARLVLVPDSADGALAEPEYENFMGATSFAVHSAPFAFVGMASKRLIDIGAALVLVVVLMPVALVIAFLVKLSSPGDIVFRQRRVGRNGRHFTMYKFRSMVEGAEGLLSRIAARNITEGPAFKSRDDWRITTVGYWLRRYSLDELPQLINVLKGEMSLVGPRPLPVHEALGVSQEHRRRFIMRPGLTCFWQVSGRSEIPFASWMRMDLEYVDKWSLWLDTKLLLRTIPAVVAGRGAY